MSMPPACVFARISSHCRVAACACMCYLCLFKLPVVPHTARLDSAEFRPAQKLLGRPSRDGGAGESSSTDSPCRGTSALSPGGVKWHLQVEPPSTARAADAASSANAANSAARGPETGNTDAAPSLNQERSTPFAFDVSAFVRFCGSFSALLAKIAASVSGLVRPLNSRPSARME